MVPLVTSMAATLGLAKNLTTIPTCSSIMTDPPDELELEKTERIISGKSPRCQDIVGALVDSFERFRRVEEDAILWES